MNFSFFYDDIEVSTSFISFLFFCFRKLLQEGLFCGGRKRHCSLFLLVENYWTALVLVCIYISSISSLQMASIAATLFFRFLVMLLRSHGFFLFSNLFGARSIVRAFLVFLFIYVRNSELLKLRFE